jgi:hypothetical protein
VIFCQPHFERLGERIPAKHLVDDTPMCANCYRGKAIMSEEDLAVISELRRKEWEDAEIRSKRSEAIRASWRRPGALERRREAMREAWAIRKAVAT